MLPTQCTEWIFSTIEMPDKGDQHKRISGTTTNDKLCTNWKDDWGALREAPYQSHIKQHVFQFPYFFINLHDHNRTTNCPSGRKR